MNIDFNKISTNLIENKLSPLFINEEINGDKLYFDPRNIYDFYALEYTYKDNLKATQLSNHIFLDIIKPNILNTFSKLVEKQIQKYISRNRYVGKLDKVENYSLEELYKAMKQTRRSDMQRSNTRWEYLIENLIKLEKENNIQKVNLLIDRIYNVTHNTKTSILDKFSNHYALLEAFEFCKNAKDIKQYIGKVSPEIEDFIYNIAESKGK